MSELQSLSRRHFLELTGLSGAGLILAATVPVTPVAAGVLAEAEGRSLNLFVSVRPDGRVDIIAHRSEMGTGIRTSLPQVVADEMEADWSRVQVIQGLANADYGSQNTDGSRSIRNFYHIMRQMGAAARTLLEQAAADTWGVPANQCRARDHAVYRSSGEALAFGELAVRASKLPLPRLESLKLKASKQFRYIGKNVPIVDLWDISTGNTTYGIDVHFPGMLYATIERTPVLDGRVKSYNEKAARKVRGVRDVVEIPYTPLPSAFNPVAGVAVIADNTYSAMKGREKLAVQWEVGEHAAHDSGAYLDELARRVSGGPGEVVRERGDVDAAMAAAAKTVTALYRTPYLAHAPMEPPVATAHLHDGICEVWACTQTPQTTQKEVAKALNMAQEKVRVHVTLLGGGFGRKSKPDFSVEAALLAKGASAPVQVVWTREDDIRHDYFHSCGAQYYQGALDASGRVTAWLAREAVPPIGSLFEAGENLMSDGALSQSFGSVPFATPNLRLERHKADAHARIGWLRSVYNIPFAFAIGSFVDELAQAAEWDPREFWLELIGEGRQLDFSPEGFEFGNHGKSIEEYPYDTARLTNVIRELTASIPWGESLPDGQGWGLAASRSFLSYVAVACKVEVKDEKLAVTEMHCAMDCGTVVNPDRVHAQLEGGLVFGLSLALLGEITFEGGVPQQSNFHDYPIARINQVPGIIQTHIVASDEPPTGVGEPGVPSVAPSIANAVFAAGGRRIRELPLNKHYSV